MDIGSRKIDPYFTISASKNFTGLFVERVSFWREKKLMLQRKASSIIVQAIGNRNESRSWCVDHSSAFHRGASSKTPALISSTEVPLPLLLPFSPGFFNRALFHDLPSRLLSRFRVVLRIWNRPSPKIRRLPSRKSFGWFLSNEFFFAYLLVTGSD